MKKFKITTLLLAFMFLSNTTLALAQAASTNEVSPKVVDTDKHTVVNTSSKLSGSKNLLSVGTGDKLNPIWNREMANTTYSGAFANLNAKNGTKAYRVELRKTDPNVWGSKRAEVALSPEKPLQEHTYNFSVYLPNGGAEDYTLDPNGSEIIAQWHNASDNGEEGTYPPLAIHTGAYYNDPDHYTLEVTWDPAAISTEQQIDANHTHEQYDLGSYVQDKGKWVNWSVHVRWGWLVSQKPFIEIYKDGKKILDLQNHPNTTNDKKGVYMKLGVYKWDWAQVGERNKSILSKRVIYYNNVSIM